MLFVSFGCTHPVQTVHFLAKKKKKEKEKNKTKQNKTKTKQNKTKKQKQKQMNSLLALSASKKNNTQRSAQPISVRRSTVRATPYRTLLLMCALYALRVKNVWDSVQNMFNLGLGCNSSFDKGKN